MSNDNSLLKVDGRFDSNASGMPFTFQSVRTTYDLFLALLIFYDILRQGALPFREQRTWRHQTIYPMFPKAGWTYTPMTYKYLCSSLHKLVRVDPFIPSVFIVWQCEASHWAKLQYVHVCYSIKTIYDILPGRDIALTNVNLVDP